VYLLGPTVKAAGFSALLVAMAVIAGVTTVFVSLLPDRPHTAAPPVGMPAPAPGG
jgi:hypothetical protein